MTPNDNSLRQLLARRREQAPTPPPQFAEHLMQRIRLAERQRRRRQRWTEAACIAAVCLLGAAALAQLDWAAMLQPLAASAAHEMKGFRLPDAAVCLWVVLFMAMLHGLNRLLRRLVK